MVKTRPPRVRARRPAEGRPVQGPGQLQPARDRRAVQMDPLQARPGRDPARRHRSRRLFRDRRHGARGAAAGRGRRIIFRDIPAGEVFGEHSAIDGRARFADVLAVRESLLASMSPEVFRAILANHASVRERLMRRLTGSVRELADRLLELGAQPVQRRIWVELLRLARVAGIDANRARLDPAPTHNDIASRVGTSREQVSRELSQPGAQGLLERAGRTLVLRDVAALERLAGDPRPDAEAAPAAIADASRASSPASPPPRQRRAILVAEVSDSVAHDGARRGAHRRALPRVPRARHLPDHPDARRPQHAQDPGRRLHRRIPRRASRRSVRVRAARRARALQRAPRARRRSACAWASMSPT